MINGGAKVFDSIFGLEFLAVQLKIQGQNENSKQQGEQNKTKIKTHQICARECLCVFIVKLALDLLCFGSDTMSQNEGVSF